MERIEELSDEAADLGIALHEENDLSVDALYMEVNGAEHIMLRRTGTCAERTCWLAEELGHHHNRPARVLRYDTVDDWRAEAQARRWAHNKLLTVDAIRTAAANTDDIYEIAFTLGVSVPFLREAIEDYEARGLWDARFISDCDE